MKIWTSAQDIELIHPRDLINIINEEAVSNTIQQYVIPSHASPPITNSFLGISTATYQRQLKQIKHFNDKEYFILNSFMMDLYEHGRFEENYGTTFNETVENAAVECLNNFATPTHVVVFNPNVVVVGEFSRDTVMFKTMGDKSGTLVVYMPNKFTVMHSPEPCPYFPVEPRYGQFVSNILLSQTMKRLDLQ